MPGEGDYSMKRRLPVFLLIALSLAATLGAVAYRLRRRVLARLFRLPMPRYRVDVTRNIPVTMRDGVTLATDHYAPQTSDALPTILIRCPYGTRPDAGVFGLLLSFLALRFAERGYHVVVQDVRGRFDSGGAFFPYMNERRDGLDTLAWIQAQPWFNGQIGTWGPSYLGMVQWPIADQPVIRAMLPSMTGSKLYRILYPDGALDLALVMRWLKLFQVIDQRGNQLKLISPRTNWSIILGSRDVTARMMAVSAVMQTIEQQIEAGFAGDVGQADQIVLGSQVDYYQMWLKEHDPHSVLWQEADALTRLDQIHAPVHLVGGWYDFFLRALLDDYAALRAAGQRPYLTLGPWHHFSHAFIMLDTLSIGLQWFDTHLKGIPGLLRKKPVRIFVMGAKQWREMESWPPPAQPTPYYLRAGHALSAESPTETQHTEYYRYDPADPTPALGGTQFSPFGGPFDNRPLEARTDVLTFTTPPLERDLEVIGPVRLILYVRSSLPYADFFGRLCEVSPSGLSVNLCDGLYRLAPGQIVPAEDGSTRLEIDLWVTANRFRRGYSLRLLVASGAHPHWARNSGTGDPVGGPLLAADQTIYLDAAHPSALILPVTAG